MKKKRLLCASDLTPRSDEAVLRTALLARQMNAQALFVHAVDDSQSGRVVRMKVNRAHVRLLSQSERAMQHARQDAEVSIRLGKPLSVIAAASAKWNPDLIVLAAPRQRRWDLVVGTTAERLIRATRRAVLIVSGPAREAYRNVVLATDLTRTTAQVAHTAADMGLLDHDYTWLVHAFGPPCQSRVAMQTRDEEQLARYGNAWRAAAVQEVAGKLAQAGVDATRVYIQSERAFDAIEHAVEIERPELLVMGVSRWLMLERLFWGSVADQVLRKIDCDILALPPPATFTSPAQGSHRRGPDRRAVAELS